MSDAIERYCDEVYDAARTVPGDQVVAAARALLEVHRRGRAVFVLCPPEDGESAGHLANALAQGIGTGPFRFQLVRLCGTPGEVAAWQADWAYEDVYAEQMRGRVRPGDAVIAVSRRGQSLGLVRALQAARRAGAVTLAIVGFDGGAIKGLADICLHVRSDHMERVEDVQMMLAHLLPMALRELFAGGQENEMDEQRPGAESGSAHVGSVG